VKVGLCAYFRIRAYVHQAGGDDRIFLTLFKLYRTRLKSSDVKVDIMGVSTRIAPSR